MKLQFSASLALLAALVMPQGAHAQPRAKSKPQLLGVQKNAVAPTPSFKGNLLVVEDEQTDGFQVWSVPTRRPLWKSIDVFMAISDDERIVVVAHGGQVKDGFLDFLKGAQLDVLDAQDGHLLRHLVAISAEPENEDEGYVLSFCLSPDGATFRLATEQYLYIYDVAQGGLQTQNWTRGKEQVVLWDATFSFHSNQVVGCDGQYAVFNATTGVQIRQLPPLAASKLKDTDGTINVSIGVSPDDVLFVENHFDDTPNFVFRLSDGKLLWRASDWSTFSFDGRHVYMIDDNGLGEFDARTGRKLRTFEGFKDSSFTPSQDGKWIYETREDKIYRWPLSP